tara:strand:+ start:271 stop:426 length:156 start_codon:yes stop_codon:yes gene_type:complete
VEFLKSKKISLVCAFLNVAIALTSITDGSWGWAVISAGLAIFCYRNYLKEC